MSFYVDSIQYCNCAYHMIFSSYTRCRTSEFICGCELDSIKSFLMSIHIHNFDSQQSCIKSNFPHGNSLSIYAHKEVISCRAFRMLELGLHTFVWIFRLLSAFRLNKLHMGNSFVDQGFSHTIYTHHCDINLDTYGTHNLVFFRRLLHKSKKFRYSQLRLNSFHRNRLLNVFSYMGSILHDGNFFSICV